MSKKLPYFQFESAQYLAGNIQLCSLAAQGLFINICSLYWQRDCQLTKDQLERKYNNPELIKELLHDEIIIFNDSDVIIKFLDEQHTNILKSKQRLSDAGRKGAEIKKEKALLNKIKKGGLSVVEAPLKQLDNIIEDNIIEKNIIIDKIPLEKVTKFSFKNSLLDYGFKKQLVEDWLKVRKTKKATNSETAYNIFINEIKKSKRNPNEILSLCIEKDWKSFKFSWLDNIKEKSSEKKESNTARLLRIGLELQNENKVQ